MLTYCVCMCMYKIDMGIQICKHVNMGICTNVYKIYTLCMHICFEINMDVYIFKICISCYSIYINLCADVRMH